MNNMENQSQAHVEMLEKELVSYIPEGILEEKIVRDAMVYSVVDGGKRVRPVLLLEFFKLCSGQDDVTLALPFACGLEYIHCYSLVHDDLPLMDNDDMRRGKPSTHKKYGETNALLAGDALLTLAFETILTKANAHFISYNNIVDATGVLACNAGITGMVGGQTIDLSHEGKDITIETLQTMDYKKTGGLISAAAEMGAIIAGADKETRNHAREYGLKLGLSFQIIDDILDVTANEKTLGKPVQSDVQQNKSTYVSLLGLEKARKLAKEMSNEAITHLSSIQGDKTFLTAYTHALLTREY